MSGNGANRAVTLGDVAKRAQVSIATASKALNGREDVADATRRRVLLAADELSFTPNAMALPATTPWNAPHTMRKGEK